MTEKMATKILVATIVIFAAAVVVLKAFIRFGGT